MDTSSNTELRKITSDLYQKEPNRYELRNGNTSDAPKCPYGNTYKWIGFDLVNREYVRFTTSVFKQIMNQNNAQ